MKKSYLLKNPELFQGESYLKSNKNYFEGWYYKNTSDKEGISFIPGISVSENKKSAFIQIITNDASYNIDYPIEEFKFNHKPFYIEIGDNFFSKDYIHIDIKDEIQNLIIYGDIKYSNSKMINTNLLSPNIMGPFSYLSFMECNHAILCMKSDAFGFITINDHTIQLEKGIGYIEKDWGISFPKSYIWCQGNKFEKNETAFMLSIADIPFKLFHFTGLICSVIIDEKEYRFASYNFSKLIKYEVTLNTLNVILKKGAYYLEVHSKFNSGSKLSAPIEGKMEKSITESINSEIYITLKKKNKIIFSDKSLCCGLEIVKN